MAKRTAKKSSSKPQSDVLADVTFTLLNETKGAVRYTEDGEPESQIVRSLYLRKTAVGDDRPEHVRVTVTRL